MAAVRTVILDGGMGRELQRRGAPFRQPEWSALALSEAPQAVEAVHAAYIQAGADVITSNSYAVVPFHIGEARFAAEGQALAALAGELARRAVVASGQAVRVAGSLPPLFGSYRPDLFEADRVSELLTPLVTGLAPYVDLWLAETQSSIVEARAIHAGLPADGKPFWLSFTLKDEDTDEVPRLRSGEPVVEAAEAAAQLGVQVLLFNCSQPEVIGAAIDAARQTFERLGWRSRLVPTPTPSRRSPRRPRPTTASTRCAKTSTRRATCNGRPIGRSAAPAIWAVAAGSDRSILRCWPSSLPTDTQCGSH